MATDRMVVLAGGVGQGQRPRDWKDPGQAPGWSGRVTAAMEASMPKTWYWVGGRQGWPVEALWALWCGLGARQSRDSTSVYDGVLA